MFKIFLILCLSTSLLFLDFSAKGIVFKTSYAETVKTDGVGDGDMISSLTMTAIGLLSSQLYKCKLTLDMLL